MRVEFDLARAVEQDEGIFCEFLELFHQPIYVLDEVLHTVDEASIWTILQLLLYIVERDQVTDVNVAFILEDLSSRV